MELVIREVLKDDNLSLARMIRRVFEEFDAPTAGTVYSDPTTDDLYGLFRENRSVLWVAELNGEALGCCGIYPTPGLDQECAELVKFYLDTSERGKGTGKALLQRSINSARDLGYNTLYLESMPHFSRALGIYEGLGFKTLSGPLGASGHTGCDIWMLKEL
ncbi:MAG: GNAT family N-acetyltransferase [Bacteroides sp.]|nr:GNAT family N-acetyltransferase [Bacteroides sp.]